MALVEIRLGEVTTVTLNDPSTRNAMSEAMAAEFSAAMAKISADKTVRVVILTGAGEAFSSGGNLSMLEEKTKLSLEENERKMREFYSSFLSIFELSVPTIAAINGHAVGAGCCLSLACDLRIAVIEAKIGLNFVALGLHPGMGATFFVPRLVGPAKAAEMLYSASILSASEAENVGLINHVCDRSQFAQKVEELAKIISFNGPQSIKELKESLSRDLHKELKSCLEREARMQAHDYVGKEFLEGVTAAKEKRRAKF